MNLFVTIPLTLLVILATLFYLAKVKNENLGSFFKWSGYLVLVAAVGLLTCLMFKGVRKMTQRNGGANMECTHMQKGMKCMRGGCSGMQDCSGMNKMNCSQGVGMGDRNCCGGMGMMGTGKMGAGCTHMKSESTIDTIDGKIIKKEIEIVEKE